MLLKTLVNIAVMTEKIQTFFYIALAAAFCLTGVAGTAYAIQDLYFSNRVGMDFGRVEYSGNGTASLGTDGNIIYAGGVEGDGLGTPASVLVNLNGGGNNNAYIECETSAVLANAVGETVDISNVEIVVGNANRRSAGSGIACRGLGTSVGFFDFSGTANSRIVFMGGRLNANSNITAGGDFSTANPGGNPITLIVVRL